MALAFVLDINNYLSFIDQALLYVSNLLSLSLYDKNVREYTKDYAFINSRSTTFYICAKICFSDVKNYNDSGI